MKKQMKFAAVAAVGMLLAAALAGPVFGTAATDNRNTPQRDGEFVSVLQGSNVIYAGTIVAITNGLAAPAVDGAGQIVIGRAEKKSDNTGANYSATGTVLVRRGCFRWANDSLTNANIGNFAYVEDDSTVTTAGNSTAKIIAGILVDVDADGAWVDTRTAGSQGATSHASLTVTGNAAVGGTLAVTGASTLTGALTVTGAVISVASTTTPSLTLGTNGTMKVLGTNLVFITASGTTTNVVVNGIGQ